MLPFLKPDKAAAVIIAKRKKNGSQEIEETVEDMPELKAAVEDLISAVHAKDASRAMSAFKAAFLALESKPHEEAEHEEQE